MITLLGPVQDFSYWWRDNDYPFAPQVTDLTELSAVGNGYHCWGVYGGRVYVKYDSLVLELVKFFDWDNPNWPELADIHGLALDASTIKIPTYHVSMWERRLSVHDHKSGWS